MKKEKEDMITIMCSAYVSDGYAIARKLINTVLCTKVELLQYLCCGNSVH